MKYINFELISLRQIGQDKLNNPIYEKESIGTFKGRITPWTADNIALEGREYTSSNCRMITQVGRQLLEIAKYIQIDGKDYEFKKVENAERWRVIDVKGWHV